MRGARRRIPSFTRGVKQLSAKDVEGTRWIANARIHVERFIGFLRQKYTIWMVLCLLTMSVVQTSILVLWTKLLRCAVLLSTCALWMILVGILVAMHWIYSAMYILYTRACTVWMQFIRCCLIQRSFLCLTLRAVPLSLWTWPMSISMHPRWYQTVGQWKLSQAIMLSTSFGRPQ